MDVNLVSFPLDLIPAIGKPAVAQHEHLRSMTLVAPFLSICLQWIQVFSLNELSVEENCSALVNFGLDDTEESNLLELFHIEVHSMSSTFECCEYHGHYASANANYRY